MKARSASPLFVATALFVPVATAWADIPELAPVSVVGTAEGSEAAGYRTDTVKSLGPWGARDVLDTPYTVTTASSALMQNTLASSQDDVWRLNPLVGSSKLPVSYGGNPWIISRGFSVLGSDQENGVRLPYTPVAMIETLDRVELFSGLSGFLNGGSSGGRVGGSVNYVTKRPTAEALTQVTVGDYDGSSFFTHLDVSRKLDEDGKAAIRFNLVDQNGDTSISGQSISRRAASAALDLHVSQNLLLQFNVEDFHYRINGVSPLWRLTGGLTSYPSALDPSKLWSQPWTYSQRDGDTVGTNLTYNLSDSVQVRSGLLYSEQRTSSIYTFNTIHPDNTYSQQLLPYAPSKAYGGGGYLFADWSFSTGQVGHKLTAGVTRSISNVDGTSDGNTNSTNSIIGSLSSPIRIDQGSVTYAGSYGTQPTYRQQTNTQTSWIVGDTVDFTKQLSALVGLNNTNVVSTSFNTDGSTASQYDKTKTTPTATLMYKPTSQVLTYAGYMESLEPGSIVGAGYTNSNTTLPPLMSRQVELGAKAQADNVLLTSSLFRIEKGNQYSNNATPVPTYVQDGRQVNTGVEFTATGKATSRLTVVGGATFLRPTIENSNNASLIDKDPIGVARRTAKLYAEYQLPEMEAWVLTGGVYYNGRVYQDALNTVQLPSFTTVDLGTRYTTKVSDKSVVFRLNVTNIFARRYWITDTFATQNFLGDPRRISASATLSF